MASGQPSPGKSKSKSPRPKSRGLSPAKDDEELLLERSESSSAASLAPPRQAERSPSPRKSPSPSIFSKAKNLFNTVATSAERSRKRHFGDEQQQLMQAPGGSGTLPSEGEAVEEAMEVDESKSWRVPSFAASGKVGHFFSAIESGMTDHKKQRTQEMVGYLDYRVSSGAATPNDVPTPNTAKSNLDSPAGQPSKFQFPDPQADSAAAQLEAMPTALREDSPAQEGATVHHEESASTSHGVSSERPSTRSAACPAPPGTSSEALSSELPSTSSGYSSRSSAASTDRESANSFEFLATWNAYWTKHSQTTPSKEVKKALDDKGRFSKLNDIRVNVLHRLNEKKCAYLLVYTDFFKNRVVVITEATQYALKQFTHESCSDGNQHTIFVKWTDETATTKKTTSGTLELPAKENLTKLEVSEKQGYKLTRKDKVPSHVAFMECSWGFPVWSINAGSRAASDVLMEKVVTETEKGTDPAEEFGLIPTRDVVAQNCIVLKSTVGFAFKTGQESYLATSASAHGIKPGEVCYNMAEEGKNFGIMFQVMTEESLSNNTELFAEPKHLKELKYKLFREPGAASTEYYYNCQGGNDLLVVKLPDKYCGDTSKISIPRRESLLTASTPVLEVFRKATKLDIDNVTSSEHMVCKSGYLVDFDASYWVKDQGTVTVSLPVLVVCTPDGRAFARDEEVGSMVAACQTVGSQSDARNGTAFAACGLVKTSINRKLEIFKIVRSKKDESKLETQELGKEKIKITVLSPLDMAFGELVKGTKLKPTTVST